MADARPVPHTVPPSTPQGRQSAEVAEQTKTAIVEAALDTFADHGFEGASLRAIAQGAGVTHGLIRHHFGNKEDIFRAVVDHSVAIYEAAYQGIYQLIRDGAHLEDPVGVLKRSIRTFASVSARHPEMMRLLMHEGSKPSERVLYLRDRIAQLDDLYDTLFAEAQARGMLRHFDCDTYFLFLLTNCGLVFGLTAVSSLYVGGDVLSQEQVEAHVERIIATLFSD